MFTEKKGKEQNQPKESTVLMEKEKKKKKDTKLLYYNEKSFKISLYKIRRDCCHGTSKISPSLICTHMNLS